MGVPGWSKPESSFAPSPSIEGNIFGGLTRVLGCAFPWEWDTVWPQVSLEVVGFPNVAQSFLQGEYAISNTSNFQFLKFARF